MPRTAKSSAAPSLAIAAVVIALAGFVGAYFMTVSGGGEMGSSLFSAFAALVVALLISFILSSMSLVKRITWYGIVLTLIFVLVLGALVTLSLT